MLGGDLGEHFKNLHLNLLAGASIRLLLPGSSQFDSIPINSSNVDDTLESILQATPYYNNKEWRAFLYAYINLLNKVGDIWQLLTKCYTTVTPIYLSNSDNGVDITPTLKLLSTALVKYSFRISKEASSHAASLLSRLLAASNTDIPQRRRVLVHTANMLSWTYFKLRRLHSLPTALKAVIPIEDELKNNYPASEITTYRYWCARSKLAEWRVGAADHHFSIAYMSCHYNSIGNLRRIVSYWLTCALILCRAPTEDMLIRYGLEEPFGELFRQLRRGDVGGLYSALNQPNTRNFFIKMGVYTMLKEKLECVVHRSLLRKILTARGDENRIIPLKIFLSALNFTAPDEEYDVDDAEAIAVSLIDQEFIGASIQHSSRTLVLAKANSAAFPIISQKL
ncbi:hypothetical protein E3Q24_04018 [Wallemia mellicola]|nr:hypothetical protein E3Q24_04018 [Wallemia mellicola]